MSAEVLPQSLAIYVIRAASTEGRSTVRFCFALGTSDRDWPHVTRRTLAYGDDDDLDDILGTVEPRLRALLHLAINAILYSTSAGVPWPIARSRIAAVRAGAKGRGKAKQARVANRVSELKGRYSSEDVFYLPGRIPISQLRAIEATERGHGGAELMSRFMVRGHWRRAPSSWRDSRLRWIEPYWKGPELAAIVEKEYQLKL